MTLSDRYSLTVRNDWLHLRDRWGTFCPVHFDVEWARGEWVVVEACVLGLHVTLTRWADPANLWVAAAKALEQVYSADLGPMVGKPVSAYVPVENQGREHGA